MPALTEASPCLQTRSSEARFLLVLASLNIDFTPLYQEGGFLCRNAAAAGARWNGAVLEEHGEADRNPEIAKVFRQQPKRAILAPPGTKGATGDDTRQRASSQLRSVRDFRDTLPARRKFALRARARHRYRTAAGHRPCPPWRGKTGVFPRAARRMHRDTPWQTSRGE